MKKSLQHRAVMTGSFSGRAVMLAGAALVMAGPAVAADRQVPQASATTVVETLPAPAITTVDAADVLGGGGIDMRAMRQHLAQTLGPDSERNLNRFRYDMMGQSGQLNVVRRSAFGTIYAAGSPHNSGSFDRDVVVGGVGLLNVAWAGLKRSLKD